MNICFFPENFPPQKGGISIWLNSLCDYTSGNIDVSVVIEYRQGCEEFDNTKSYRVVRPKQCGLYGILKTCYFVLCLLYKKIIQEYTNHNNFHNLKLRTLFYLFSKSGIKELKVFFNVFPHFVRINQNKSIDLIFIGRLYPNALIAYVIKFFFNIPYIILTHGMEILQIQQNKTKLLSFLINADRLIANSHYTAQLLQNLSIEENKITIIHPGVNTKKFVPTKKPEKLIQMYNLSNCKVLLTIANLVERKGHDLIISCLPDIIKEIPNIKYLIVGDGENKDKLMKLVYSLNLEKNIIFTGTISDDQIVKFYNCCDIFVMPSRQINHSVEGFGISYLEANACGKPVVGGKSGGISDAIIHNETGFLVDPYNKEELASTILYLLKNEAICNKMGIMGCERVNQEFTWDVSNNKTYQTIINIKNN